MAKRSRAQERKKERQQARRRNQQLYIVAAVVVVAIFLGALYLLTSLPTEAPLPNTFSRYENLRRGFTDQEGYPRLGNPNAPVTLMEFSSFACPTCLSFEQNVFPQLLPRIESGEIQFIFVPLETGSVQNPDGANRTALCAGQQGKFWEMADTLFSWHATFGNNAFQDGRLRAGVEALGLDTNAFNSCFRSAKIDGILATAQSEGVTGTPTVRIDGAAVADSTSYDVIAAAIDAKGPFSNLEPGTISNPNTPEATVEATVEATSEMTTETVEATDEAMSSETATETVEATSEAKSSESATEVVEATAEATESN